MDDSEPQADAMDVVSQFIDVITTFKCKACPFICYKQEDLVNHVKAKHLPSQHSNSSQPDLDSSRTDCLEDVAEANSTNTLMTLVDDSSASIDGQYMQGSGLQPISIQTYVNDATTEQVVLVDTASGRSAGEIFPQTEPQQELFLCGQCNMGFQTVENCKTHMVQSHKADAENLSAPATAISLNSTSIEIATDRVDAPPTCNSSTTFKTTSKEHTELAIADRQEMPNGKVSMGTQVVKKKVGRKSKAELLEMAKREGLSSEPTSPEPTDTAVDNPDEDPADSTVTYIEIEVPGKRKRRVPRHLTDSYYVPLKTKFMTNPDASDDSSTFHHRGPRRRNLSRALVSPNRCNKCRARFTTEDKLDYHMKTHSNEVDAKTQLLLFKCPEPACSEETAFKTVYWADLKQHAWKLHQIDLDMIGCDLCGYKTTVQSKMVIHKQIHSSERPYTCEVCHKAFKQMAQLKNHSLMHIAGVDIKEKESVSGRHWFVQAECETCKRTFANQKSLQCHIDAVHQKIKPYACKFCGHTAATKAMMQLHMRTHTGEKPFKCPLCEYVTADHNSMRRHRMRHTGDKPYQCPHCSYACIQAVSLKLHLKSKHPGSDKCYSCSKCPYRSVNKTLFTNHMRDHDMGLINESDLVPSSSEDGSIKLGTITDLTDGTANVTQLIISALNAIAPSLSEDGESVTGHIDTTIETIANTAEGLKAHKISFQIPPTATRIAKTAEVVVQEQTSQSIPMEMDPLQAAALHSQIPREALEIDESMDKSDRFQTAPTGDITLQEPAGITQLEGISTDMNQLQATSDAMQLQQGNNTNVQIRPTMVGCSLAHTDVHLEPSEVATAPEVVETVPDNVLIEIHVVD